jgi:hypothetical protein
MNSIITGQNLQTVAIVIAAATILISALRIHIRGSKPQDEKGTTALRSDIVLAITNGDVSLEQLLDIASTHGKFVDDVYSALQYCLREALTGRQELLSPKKEAIGKLLDEFREQILGTAIPDDTAILLNDVKRELADRAPTIEPLVENIRRLVAENDRISASEKTKSTWSLAIGVAGVLIGIFLWRFPYSTDAPVSKKSSDEVEIALQSAESGVFSCLEASCVLRYRSLGGMRYINVPLLETMKPKK